MTDQENSTDAEIDTVPGDWESLEKRGFFAGKESFATIAGPYFYNKGKAPGVGFLAEEKHLNLAGVVHGGCLATLADMALWDICAREVGPFRAVTVTLNTEFLGSARAGEFISAEGDALKASGSIFFARGLITARGRPVMSFSGSLKRLRTP
ncbi:MAG: PaaI family thioesterase [Pseudomonadota bacterium]